MRLAWIIAATALLAGCSSPGEPEPESGPAEGTSSEGRSNVISLDGASYEVASDGSWSATRAVDESSMQHADWLGQTVTLVDAPGEDAAGELQDWRLHADGEEVWEQFTVA